MDFLKSMKKDKYDTEDENNHQRETELAVLHPPNKNNNDNIKKKDSFKIKAPQDLNISEDVSDNEQGFNQ